LAKASTYCIIGVGACIIGIVAVFRAKNVSESSNQEGSSTLESESVPSPPADASTIQAESPSEQLEENGRTAFKEFVSRMEQTRKSAAQTTGAVSDPQNRLYASVESKLKQAASTLDKRLSVGLEGTLVSSSLAGDTRITIKEINGIQCIRSENDKIGVLVSNQDGMWLEKDGKLIEVNFLRSMIAQAVDAMTSSANLEAPPTDTYTIETFLDSNGVEVDKITRIFSAERQQLFKQAALADSQKPKHVDSIIQSIPVAAITYVDSHTNQMLGQFSVNASGKQVGTGIVYNQTGTKTLDDSLFTVVNSKNAIVASSPAELKVLISPKKHK
jgi:hypothetical protein